MAPIEEIKIFRCSPARLAQHRAKLAKDLQSILKLKSPLAPNVAVVADQDVATMIHPQAEWIPRRRGHGLVPAILLPFEASDGRCSFWASYRDVWQISGSKTRAFLSADLTFFRGAVAESKDQIFRVEWCGPRNTGGQIGFSPRLAAQPHWQFDEDDEQELIAASALRELSSSTGEVEEFVGLESDDTLPLKSVELGRWRRVHFAAKADWANQRFDPDDGGKTPHAHSPQNSTHIENWVVSTLAYAIEELSSAYAGS